MKRYDVNVQEIGLEIIRKLDINLITKRVLDVKEIELTLHPGNYKRRVRYNEKNFDVLVVSFNDNGNVRYFAAPVKALPDNDSIHLKYDPLSKEVGWSPKSVHNVIEITSLRNVLKNK